MKPKSRLKGLKVGDLVCYGSKQKSESVINAGRTGIIVKLGKVLGVGFQSVFVMWSDNNEVTEVVENYLHRVHEA